MRCSGSVKKQIPLLGSHKFRVWWTTFAWILFNFECYLLKFILAGALCENVAITSKFQNWNKFAKKGAFSDKIFSISLQN